VDDDAAKFVEHHGEGVHAFAVGQPIDRIDIGGNDRAIGTGLLWIASDKEDFGGVWIVEIEGEVVDPYTALLVPANNQLFFYHTNLTIMRRRTLYHILTGADVSVKIPRKRPLTPDAINYFYLEKGHVMEYYEIGQLKKRVVALFWGPNELVIPSSNASKFDWLDEVQPTAPTYGKIIRKLRHDPMFWEDYRDMKAWYREKVNERLVAMYTMGPKQRLEELAQRQPWVFDLVEEEDVSNYLKLTVGVSRRLKGKMA
jgi:hypothetical protein